ncbi:hypothetical protein GCM10020370_15850 [Paenibacillus hodogayensis]
MLAMKNAPKTTIPSANNHLFFMNQVPPYRVELSAKYAIYYSIWASAFEDAVAGIEAGICTK